MWLDTCSILDHMSSVFHGLQATLAACNVTAVLKQQPMTQGDMLPFVDGPFDEIPGEAPSIVNAKDLPKDKFPQFK